MLLVQNLIGYRRATKVFHLKDSGEERPDTGNKRELGGWVPEPGRILRFLEKIDSFLGISCCNFNSSKTVIACKSKEIESYAKLPLA